MNISSKRIKSNFSSFIIKYKYYIAPAIVVLVFGTIFCLISLVNHYNFRTHAFDLAINNQAIYHYSKFRWDANTIMNKSNILSDHFSLYEMFVSPFRWLFGSYTLLLFQIIMILLGGIGTYELVKMNTRDNLLSLLALVFFFSVWGIYSALSFDYHDNVTGTMFVPWFFYYFQRKKYLPMFIFFTLILISKENMALWAVFIGFGLFFLYIKDKQLRWMSLLLSSIAFLYFIIVLNYVMPYFFDKNMVYKQFKYFSALGNNLPQMIGTIIHKPLYAISLLFNNPSNLTAYNGIKAELHYMVLLSGGIFLIFRPQYIIMLLPIYGQKLFNDLVGRWGINVHYSIEFVPILTICAFDVISKINKVKIKKIIAFTATIVCIGATTVKLDKRVSLYYSTTESRFYSKEHYRVNYDVPHINKVLKLIPPDSRVCAQEMLCPHLAFRDYIYLLPYCKDPDYVLFFIANKSIYPFNKIEDYNNCLNSYLHSPSWNSFYADSTILIFKKNESENKKSNNN